MFYVFGISKFECNYRNIKRDVFGHRRRVRHSVHIRVCRPIEKTAAKLGAQKTSAIIIVSVIIFGILHIIARWIRRRRLHDYCAPHRKRHKQPNPAIKTR